MHIDRNILIGLWIFMVAALAFFIWLDWNALSIGIIIFPLIVVSVVFTTRLLIKKRDTQEGAA
ncbi:hypothetical protein HMPREF1219_01683 [Corynebacterium pyruviciproducens ATCC BAA-1742]|uniref:Uncharacterized protein n=1 Tax=Corynebacterium pyruviciproducens ATCC BAA-1742 TaxID=1125779 RepID=S2ZEQ7_9CORY|nr:hypothetical protein [Corynebacterium pyruviciproducens]EPD68502.1 hypothetical protein HMPREF1219_01683 [Corynebacterium pyruviciproducens ATCC BAA-1742]